MPTKRDRVWGYDWACFEVGTNPVALERQLTHSFRMSSKVSSCFSSRGRSQKKTRKRVLSKFKFYNGNIGENKLHDGETTAAVNADLLDTTPAWRDV